MSLFYYSISLFLFCFIRCLSFHFLTAKVQTIFDSTKFIFFAPAKSYIIAPENVINKRPILVCKKKFDSTQKRVDNYIFSISEIIRIFAK